MVNNPVYNTYEDVGERGGLGLYHFDPYTRGIVSTKSFDLVVLAKNPEHALELFVSSYESVIKEHKYRLCNYDSVDIEFRHDVYSMNVIDHARACLREMTVDMIEYLPAKHPFMFTWAVNHKVGAR